VTKNRCVGSCTESKVIAHAAPRTAPLAMFYGIQLTVPGMPPRSLSRVVAPVPSRFMTKIP
jgi:hypothetical protein